MGRVVTERMVGVNWGIRRELVPVLGADGAPIHDAHGLPKTEPRTTLVFESMEGAVKHVTEVPFDDDAKAKLVEALTGGIIIAGNGTPAPPAI